MTWKQLFTPNSGGLIKLVWVLPTASILLLVELSLHAALAVPVPFLSIMVCVVIAGAFGGQRSGLLAGAMAALFIAHAYFEQFGPPSLTGGVPQAALGSVLFLLIGFQLGRLKDQRDSSLNLLRENEKHLASSLDEETVEKDRQISLVAESEERLKTAVRIAGIGHFTFSAITGNCDYCSEQHAAHLGMTSDEFYSRTARLSPTLFYVLPEDRQIVLEAISGIDAGEPQVFEYRALHSDGKIRFIREFEEPVFDDTGKHVKSVGTSIDLTDLRHAEARARQSQRIEAIGTLTGGVAHDFNNLLAVILGNLELSLTTEQTDEWRELIEAAIQATNRGASLTKNLLSFARQAPLEPARMDLNKLIQNTMAWCTRVLPATIEIENSLMAGLWDVELDTTSTENALINILLNARDAMPGGGKLTIETANMRIGDEYVAERDEDIEPGRYVMLAISDTGHGIPSDKIEAIFEPFYTDKPVGQGSGLGLSMVQGFIKQSGGAIRVYSEVGVGTTFKLYFKAATQAAGKPQREVRELMDPTSNRAEVLVVEDEQAVAHILKRILEDSGYTVTTAASGDEALEEFKSAGRFDVLVTDIVMPGTLQGPALAKAIRLIDPDIPCIFMSGYASEATVHGNGLKPSDVRLMKPVSRLDILHAISKALNSGKENERDRREE